MDGGIKTMLPIEERCQNFEKEKGKNFFQSSS